MVPINNGKLGLFTVLVLSLTVFVCGDIYMHFPAGSNNRNRERNANRANANRMFDSQNNGAGGYPWRGSPLVSAKADALTFYEGTEIDVVWTNQHACNSNSTFCSVVIQYMCNDIAPGLRDGYPTGAFTAQDNNAATKNEPNYLQRSFKEAGQNQQGTNTIADTKDAASCKDNEARFLNSYVQASVGNATLSKKYGSCNPCVGQNTGTGCERGQHEDYYFYDTCKRTKRNDGLFHADRKMKASAASRATRQNPNGNRRGLECPEERDYYPYWNPSPWVDAGVIVSDLKWCEYYQAESQNVKDSAFCDGNFGTTQNTAAPIDKRTCESATDTNGQKGVWRTWKAKNKIFPNLKKPDCTQLGKSFQNYLGYTLEGKRPTYKWKIPEYNDDKTRECTLRIRYNISTNDYASMNGFGGDDIVNNSIVDNRYDCKKKIDNIEQNQNDVDTATGASNVAGTCNPNIQNGVHNYPLYNRPEVKVFKDGESPLSIALNTDQSGRTFQDRSHVFWIAPKAQIKKDYPDKDCSKVRYVHIMGKRGNIVQVYPSVEYMFVDQEMSVESDTCLLWQFGNSFFNPNRNPNNAEGWRYSDSTNVVESLDLNHNFPRYHVKANPKTGKDEEEASDTFFDYKDALYMGLLGQAEILKDGVYKNANDANNNKKTTTFKCIKEKEATAAGQKDDHPLLCGKMNVGHIGKIQRMTKASKAGLFSFVTTRNNNFSNRKQTLSIQVAEREEEIALQRSAEAAKTAGTVIGVVLLIGAITFGVIVVLAVVGVIRIPFVEKMKMKKKNKEVDDKEGQDAGKKNQPFTPKKTSQV